VKNAYKATANITFRVEMLLVAGPVVCMVLMNSKLPKRKVVVIYLVKLKHVNQGCSGFYTSYSDIGLSQA
jgi:hypothetical protein